MAKVVVFTSPKGGCGATFACALTANMLAESSQKVLALDMCFEKCTLDFALGFQNEYVYTLTDVIDGQSTLDEALCRGKVDFLRADYEDSFFEFEKAEDVLKDAKYDFILIDTQAFNKRSVQSLCDFADKIVAVTDCTPVSSKLTQSFTDNMSNTENIFILINKIVPYYIRDGFHFTVDELLDSIGYPLLGLIPWDCGAELITTDSASTINDFPALKEIFSNISKRLLGQKVSACDIEDIFKSGITHKYFTKGRK